MVNERSGNKKAGEACPDAAIAGSFCDNTSTLYLCRMKILMVCLGNICRSPLAEGILKKKASDAGLDWTIDSAGTNGFHVGEAPHHLSQKVAKAHGIDISDQLSRKFTGTDLDEYDVVYAMAADVVQDIRKIAGSRIQKNKVKLFLEELYPNQFKDVPDPWYGDEDGYHEVHELIDKTCDSIIEKYLVNSKQQQTK